MDEKLDIRFKMQPLMQNYACLHFCLRKEVKNLFYAGFSTKSELCVPSED